jgi:2-iminobutanoate/2-iminopropanoate deaminase
MTARMTSDERTTDRRSLLRQLAVLPAAVALVGCERTARAAPSTTPKPSAKNRQFVNPPKLHSDAAYSSVIRVGQQVYVTAQMAIDADGNIMHKGDLAKQVRYIWQQIEIAMQSVGGKLSDVVACTTHVTSADHIPIVGAVRAQVFPVNPPTTSRPIVVNAVSGISDMLVSIGAIGVIAE